MIDEEGLRAEWVAALADAEIDEFAVRLYVFDDVKAWDNSGAVWFRPHTEIGEGDQIHNPDYIRHANKPENQKLHRMAVWTAVDKPVLAGRLRHELEHARQWDRFGQPICGLYDLIRDEVLPHKAGGLDGCAGMYINAIPAEQDANAAAAMFLRERHRDSVEKVCKDADNRMLACSIVGPEPLGTLPARMVAFAFMYRDGCEKVAQNYEADFADVLDRCFSGSGDYWRRLCEDLPSVEG